MPISNLKLNDLKNIFNYVSEAIVISDEEYKIVLINDASAKKLALDYKTVYTKKLTDYIPEDEIYKVVESIEFNNNDYYEIKLKRENQEEFPALVSGKEMIIENKKYRISTILDVTELKEKEEELLSKSKQEVKKLKTHIISNVSEKTKEISIAKNASIPKIKELKNDILDVKYENVKLNKVVASLKSENKSLKDEVKVLKQNAFEFNDILELEITKAKAYNQKFSLVKVSIDKYNELVNSVRTKDKLNMVLQGIKRQFKTSVKKIDIVKHHKDGEYFFILSNANDINITNIVEKLIIPKKMENKIIIEFSYGIAHFFNHDDVQAMLYRCEKNLIVNIDKKNKEKK